ncbi:MAG: aminopeptidase [Bdellovibrionaceae bacterium]|nr:aminopeptidase [Pseudobdellovibrionaceae bacterium]|tara:strand:+ start:67776 stop:68816 length:1041 start_codon:yes stop_codon:yes gene_type:complete
MDVLKAILLVFSLTMLASCQLPYLAKTAYNHLHLMNQRVPISEALKDPSLPEKTKAKLLLAQEASAFSEDILKLEETNNYQEFVQLERDYVSYVLSAAPVYELKTYRWKFPFVGAVPYKGYKTPEEAHVEAKTFDPNEYDTYVRGAGAYSTLGWFDDPILSSMTRYSDYDLVNVIIHETVHATLFIKDHADFNERLATFIGNKGAELFYLKKEGENSKTLARIKDINHDEKIFSAFLSKEIDDLKKWYESHKGRIDKKMKEDRLLEIKNRLKTDVLVKTRIIKYKRFLDEPLNNAKLLSLKTYVYDLSDFEKAYIKLGSDFEKLIEFAKTLEDVDDPEKTLKQFVN